MPGRSLNGGVQPAARASAAAALPHDLPLHGRHQGRTWPGPFPQPLVPLVPRNQGNPPGICSGGVEGTGATVLRPHASASTRLRPRGAPWPA